MPKDLRLIPHTTANANMDGRVWVRRNVRGISPSIAKGIELNIGQKIDQPTNSPIRDNRGAVESSVELIRATSQRVKSRIIPLDKRAKARVVFRPTNKANMTTAKSRRQARQKYRRVGMKLQAHTITQGRTTSQTEIAIPKAPRQTKQKSN